MRQLLLLAAVAAACLAQYDVKFYGFQTITTFDGNALHADGFVPVPKASGEKFPLVIFANSWTMPQFEYLLKTLQWAEFGYVTLEYETRGWYESGGLINCAGPLDRRDISTVIDYAFSKADEWNINTSAVAFAGISYGGGLATEAAGFEPRISTVLSLSGWGNLTKALYDHDTVNLDWGELLLVTGDILGHPDPSLQSSWNDLLAHRNLPAVERFAGLRSGQTNVSFMNERKIPFFMSNNFLDRLFKPNYQLDFWLELEGPKILLLNQGMHAEAELTGVLDLSNYVWHQARRWLDYWLKGEQNGILAEPRIRIQPSYSSKDYINLTSWPSPRVSSVPFYFGNRGNNNFGQLNQWKMPAPVDGPLDIIEYDTASGIFDGIPLVSDALNGLIPEINELGVYKKSGAIVYMSEALSTGYQICGTPNISLSFVPSSDTWQVYAMLYDVDALDIGEIITDMHFTRYGAGNPNNQTVTLTTSFHMLCHTVPQGSRLAVGIVFYNAAYLAANTDFSAAFVYDRNSFVNLPMML
jgi:predicted acyl esterase